MNKNASNAQINTIVWRRRSVWCAQTENLSIYSHTVASTSLSTLIWIRINGLQRILTVFVRKLKKLQKCRELSNVPSKLHFSMKKIALNALTRASFLLMGWSAPLAAAIAFSTTTCTLALSLTTTIRLILKLPLISFMVESLKTNGRLSMTGESSNTPLSLTAPKTHLISMTPSVSAAQKTAHTSTSSIDSARTVSRALNTTQKSTNVYLKKAIL